MDRSKTVKVSPDARPAGLEDAPIPQRPPNTPPWVAAGTPGAGWDASDAVVSITAFASNEVLEVCNGVQVASGMVLTSQHCLDGDRYVVHFGQLRLGQASGPVTSIAGFQCDALVKKIKVTSDFGLLSIPDGAPQPYRRMVVNVASREVMTQRLAAGAPSPTNPVVAPVRMVQVINNGPDSRFRQFFSVGGRYLNRGTSCRIRYLPNQNDPRCFFKVASSYGFDHSCTGQEGSSGAPLFDAQAPLLIGVHAGTINRNAVFDGTEADRPYCAVPAGDIYDSLRSAGVLPPG